MACTNWGQKNVCIAWSKPVQKLIKQYPEIYKKEKKATWNGDIKIGRCNKLTEACITDMPSSPAKTDQAGIRIFNQLLPLYFDT